MTEASRAPHVERRPWHREPMLWLVIAIPALTVVGGLTTVVIAHRHSDTVVADEFRKEGLAINRDPARDQAARRFGVSATVTAAGGTLSVALERGTAPPPGELLVILSHATRAERDQLVALRPDTDGRYAAPLAPLARGHWYLEVSPADRSWRLTGEFVDEPGTLALRPGPGP